MTALNAWWLPPDLRTMVAAEDTLAAGEVSVSVPCLDANAVRSLALELKHRQRTVLQKRSIASIVSSLDAVAALWLDEQTPERQVAATVLPQVTGFSSEMVRESIDLEQRSSRADHMWRALRSEFGDPAVLDGFAANPHLAGAGRTMAVGPALVGAVFSSNIPALPHLTVMRSLMVKSAFWGRVSSREPTFLPLYLETLWRVDPELAGCCACLWWPSNDRVVEHAFLAESDFFVGWGSAEVERHFAAVLPPDTRSVFHGHRIGFALIDSPQALPATVEGLAIDVCRFDQQACLSPQAIFFRGSMADALAFGRRLGAAIEEVGERLPPRRLDAGEAMAVQQFRGAAELAPSFSGGALVTPESGELQWTVAVDRYGQFPHSPLHRCITVCQVDEWSEVIGMLGPIRPWLQNAALAVTGDDEGALRMALARLGVSRLCRPGDMAAPSMMWHHDGVACLAIMVRWCDEEDTPPYG
ncbi:MAG: acyl-CoA reductase [Myxococcota bacterium]|nr:acyl-CoA reductase [Myxococcota bacterium]